MVTLYNYDDVSALFRQKGYFVSDPLRQQKENFTPSLLASVTMVCSKEIKLFRNPNFLCYSKVTLSKKINHDDEKYELYSSSSSLYEGNFSIEESIINSARSSLVNIPNCEIELKE